MQDPEPPSFHEHSNRTCDYHFAPSVIGTVLRSRCLNHAAPYRRGRGHLEPGLRKPPYLKGCGQIGSLRHSAHCLIVGGPTHALDRQARRRRDTFVLALGVANECNHRSALAEGGT